MVASCARMVCKCKTSMHSIGQMSRVRQCIGDVNKDDIDEKELAAVWTK